jgi:hypothetical protein
VGGVEKNHASYVLPVGTNLFSGALININGHLASYVLPVDTHLFSGNLININGHLSSRKF